MKFAVIGATGFSGSHVCVELLNRGHDVVGISRNPAKLGKHERFQPYPLDVSTASIEEIVEAFKGIDVVVNGFNPRPGPTMYSNSASNSYISIVPLLTKIPGTFVESTRKLITAAKAYKELYFIMIGGTGSLNLPGQRYKTVADSRDIWLAIRRATVDSEAHTKHMEDRIGPGAISEAVRAYRNARVALKNGTANENDKKLIKQTEDVVRYSDNWIPDLPLAARATFLMFEGNESFQWSFVSPSALYKPGPRTGKYEVFVDEVPLASEAKAKSEDGNEFEGRLLTLSAADLAVAIVDEAEKREKKRQHWSPVSEWEGDEAMPTTISIS